MGTFGTRAQGSTSQLQGSTVETLGKALLVGGTDPERRSLLYPAAWDEVDITHS